MAAFDGKFGEAAKLYKKVGQEQKALSMYTDLRMFDLVSIFSFQLLFSGKENDVISEKFHCKNVAL